MRVGVDLDEVLCEFVQGLIRFHNANYGTSLSYDDFFSFNFQEVWGGSFDDMILKIKEYHKSEFFLNARVVVGATSAIEALSKTHDLFVITARWTSIKSETLSWLGQYFSGLFEDVFFINHWSQGESELSKGDICDRLDLDLFIDDYAPYAVDCFRKREDGSFRKVILFNRPWNKNVEVPKGVVRVSSWDECLSVIESFDE
ncbi:MAG: 5' nucleotidase, NT5C type [Candidatus Woesearchaeota archaeon]